jgi:hypothetical protein
MAQSPKRRIARRPVLTSRRMVNYRQRMRAAGLRPIQIWVPDIRDPAFADKCQAQAQAIAASDPAGEELMDFVTEIYQWPEG